MSRWWRAYDEAVDDPKLCLLSDAQHRAWFNLCCVTSQNGGKLPDIKAIAFKLRTTPAKAHKIIGELRLAGLIDDDGEGNAAPHNWNGRQYKSDVTDATNAERQQRYRDRHRNGKDTVTQTVTVTPTRDRAETEQKKDAAEAAPISQLPLALPEADLYRRGKEILGKEAGGMIKRLLKAKGNNVPLARAAIEMAATKQDPREYIGGCLRGPEPPNGRHDVDPRL